MLMNGVHTLIDQEYSGDINIVPSFRWYNPAKLLSHLSEDELLALMEGGEHSCYPNIEAIRLCTKISRTMEEILHRFEYGDLRPETTEYHRPRSSRRRPSATRKDLEALRSGDEPGSKRAARTLAKSKKTKARTKTKAKTKKKTRAKPASGKGVTQRVKAAGRAGG
jgi:NTE family protein